MQTEVAAITGKAKGAIVSIEDKRPVHVTLNRQNLPVSAALSYVDQHKITIAG